MALNHHGKKLKTKKMITVLGARPQFIKAAALSRALIPTSIEEIIIHTGQHYDEKMSDIFFEQLSIPKPKYQLSCGNLSHSKMTGEMMIGLEDHFQIEKPNAVLVYGDTNSTLAAALVAAKMHIPIVHVESGLRSFNRKMPEEINRVLVDSLSQYLFCSSEEGLNNLSNEGIKNQVHGKNVWICGDIMYDVLKYYRQKLPSQKYELQKNNITPLKYVLATLHRQENTDNPENLKNIINSLEEMNNLLPVVLPLHPRTQKKLKELGLTPKFKIIEPLGYLEMLELLENSSMVITDSGGLQKESYFCQKPCITLREETEWKELVTLGANILAGSSKDKILKAFQYFLELPSIEVTDVYGNGSSSEYITKKLEENL